MVTKEFAEASAEIDEIIKYLPMEYVEKIPIKLRKFFKQVKAKEYDVNINPYKKLNDQELKPKTKTLLTILYRNYWCDEKQRTELDKKLGKNDEEYEKLLREKYNPDNIFKNNNEKIVANNEIKEEVQLIEYKEQRWYQKLFERILSIFKKK